MKRLQVFVALAFTLAALVLLGFGCYYTFRYAADIFRDLEPYLTPAVKASLIAILIGVALVALAVRWSTARRSADALRIEKVRLFGHALDALVAGTDLAALERQLAILSGGAVIRAWREVAAEATPKRLARLVREMRRELGQSSVGFGDDALLDLVGNRRPQQAPAELRTAEAS